MARTRWAGMVVLANHTARGAVLDDLKLAVLSLHTCPLAPLGGWETGGMNVYVRELCRGLSRLGVMTDVFTRRQDPDVPTVVKLAEHARVIHVDAGAPRHRDKYAVVD